MKVEDKLDVFNKKVIAEAQAQRRITLDEAKREIDLACEEAEESAKKEAENILEKEKFKISQSKNKNLINASIEAKRSLIVLRTELIGKIVEQIIEKLDKFMLSDEYESYLIEEVSNYVKAHKEIKLILMERDLKFSHTISKVSENGVEVITAAEDFIGGFKVLVDNKNNIYDHTFKSKLDEEIKNINIFKITV